MEQNTVRRIILLTAVLALLLTFTGIAEAGTKTKPPPDEPVLYDVSLSLTAEDEGLGACGEAPGLVMEEVGGRKSRALSADETAGTSVPRLYLRAEVPWSRTHPEAMSGDRFNGCHGGALGGSDSDVPSYFIIHANRDGNLTNILWAFDVYTQEGTKGRNKTSSVKEYFRLWSSEDVSFVDAAGNACPLTPADSVTCHVAGPFEIWHYYPSEQIGVTDFSFDLTISPHE